MKTDLTFFFYPSSIAIVGASRKEGTLGRVFFDNVVKYGFRGKIYPINPKAPEIDGIPCYASIEALPEIPDVAVIMVRKELALEAVEACGKKGIKNIIMITAGFREVGGEGIEREERLLTLARYYGMRIIGPNCMGVFNTDPDVRLNASFSPTEPYTGSAAFVSQSGALGVAILELAKEQRLGFSIFISEGNKADLVDADFLEYLKDHLRTKLIMLYQESIEDVPRFRQLTGEITREKPIIALKAGRSEVGAMAASSHTGALASPDAATEALFRQCRIMRVDSLDEMVEVSLALSLQPLPAGNKVCILTNAGGPGIIATDAVDRFGLQMATLSEHTQQALRAFLPEEASVHNPVDMIASANEQTYRQALEVVLKDENVDAVIIIIVRPPVNTTPRQIAEALADVVQQNQNKTLLVVLMAQRDEACGLEIFQKLKLPVFSYPEAAARALARMYQYRQWKSTPTGTAKQFPVDKTRVENILMQAQGEGREHLRADETWEILDSYGFPLVETRFCQTVEEALQFFKQGNQPVVLKIVSADIIHKTDAGGIRLGLSSVDEIQLAWEEILKAVRKSTSPEQIHGMLVQRMVEGKRELVLGLKRDANYGPLLMFGVGGIFVEILKDVSFRIAPLTDRDAAEMLEEIAGKAILDGARGEKPVDREWMVEQLLRLSQLAVDFPQIVELDINPLIIPDGESTGHIVDARIRVAPPAEE